MVRVIRAWLLLTVIFATFLRVVSTNSVQERSKKRNFRKLIDVDVEYLQVGLEKGDFTSVDLVKAYVARIKEVNETLHMVTELNPDAISIARELDLERKHGETRGPLHGLPILVKNNIATNDKMNNTAGSFALLGAKVPRDSTVAKKLRKAGAVILGKANLSQWANYRSFDSSNGWSAYGGQTQGAYYPKQDPSGSSSGSGVSSSLGLALACLGTETDGSIVSPSEVNNLVGIKPTVGLTSRYLVIPISEHQDTVGPMARTVKDAAYLLQAIAGPDKRDNYTSAIPFKRNLPDYVAACNFSALQGVRLGVPLNVLELMSGPPYGPINSAFKEALKTLEDAGATLIDSNFTKVDQFFHSSSEGIVLEADFIVGLANYLSELTFNPLNITNLRELAKFTKEFPAEKFPHRDIGVWKGALNLGYNNTDYRFWKAYQKDLYFGGAGGLLGAIKRHKLDAVVMPTAAPSSPFGAIVGAPIVTVPLGFFPANAPVEMNNFGNLVAFGPNIPFGLSFLGSHWSEASLISFAYAYEQRTHTRNKKQPYIVPNTEIKDVLNI